MTSAGGVLLKWLRDMLVVNAALLAVTFCMPLACFWLIRTPDGALAVFFLGPLSAGVLTLIYSQWSSARRWNRMGRLKQWREDHGGLFCTVPRACGWLFGSILLSYLAESALVSATRSAAWLPAATYCPLALCWLLRRSHG